MSDAWDAGKKLVGDSIGANQSHYDEGGTFTTNADGTPNTKSGYDASQFGYGNNMSDAARQRTGALDLNAWHAQTRDGAQVNYGAAQDVDRMALDSRNAQRDAASMLRDQATGQAGSIAQMQADRQMQQAAAAQSSAAASARGPAAMALAQQQAAANTGVAAQNISGQAQVNAAQERQQAQQSYFQAMSGLRGQDASMAAEQAQRSQYQAGLNQQQNALNDAQTRGLLGMSNDIYGQQNQMNMQQQQMNASAYNSAEDRKSGVESHNADQRIGAKSVAGGLSSGLGGVGAALSDARAKTNVQPMFSDVTTKTPPGYAASREGQAGYMFGPNPVPTPGEAAMTVTDREKAGELAPGTSDYMHAMGGDASLNGTGQTKQADAEAAANQKKNMAGLSSVLMMLSDARVKQGVQPLYSDAQAKLISGMPFGLAISDVTAKQAPEHQATTMAELQGATESGLTPLVDASGGVKYASQATEPEARGGVPAASLTGRSSVASSQPSAPAPAKTPAKTKQKSLQDQIKELEAKVNSDAEQWQKGPVAVQPALDRAKQGDMGAALADMKPYAYEYKPGIPGATPGETNVGPMAQDMASNPITATAVTKDPTTGYLAIDRDKALKLSLGGVGHLAGQQQALEAEIARLKKKRGK